MKLTPEQIDQLADKIASAWGESKDPRERAVWRTLFVALTAEPVSRERTENIVAELGRLTNRSA